MNRGLDEVGGEILVVSQFTLAGSIRRGRRPDFVGAARPEDAEPLVEALVAALRARGVPVSAGVFRAHMEVELVNDGPVTFVWDDPPRREAVGQTRPRPLTAHELKELGFLGAEVCREPRLGIAAQRLLCAVNRHVVRGAA